MTAVTFIKVQSVQSPSHSLSNMQIDITQQGEREEECATCPKVYGHLNITPVCDY